MTKRKLYPALFLVFLMLFSGAATNCFSQDTIRTWQAVDSLRFSNPAGFHSQRHLNETDNFAHTLNQPATNYNYYYLLFTFFLLGIVVFARFFPYPFKLQYLAFTSRARLSELLATENEWLEAEKIFPFIISILFYSTWIVSPLLNVFALEEYSYAALIIGCILFAIIFLFLRLIQIVLSHSLDFKEIMERFSRISFNTAFVLALFSFPLIVIFISVLQINPFTDPRNTLIITSILYFIRTAKSFTACLRSEQRQLIYLIIYLCTLEIPLLLVGLKWISDNTLI